MELKRVKKKIREMGKKEIKSLKEKVVRIQFLLIMKNLPISSKKASMKMPLNKKKRNFYQK